MTKVHSTLDKMIVQMSKIERHYTVGYLPPRSDDNTPAIHLKGKWLGRVYHRYTADYPGDAGLFSHHHRT